MLQTLYTPGCIRTFTNQFLNITEPDFTMIYLADIAVGLSRAMRFGGHTKKPYSVAEHSIWCMQEAEILYPDDTELPFKILLHDAHEAYLCDVPSPVKQYIHAYGLIADKLQAAIHARFKMFINDRDKQRIAEIDKMALEYEYANKVLRWTGIELVDRARIDLFTHYFIKVCKTQVVLQP